ncbi:peptidoglycan DD-metalloendopeptidase family protein [Streptomyces sp. NPDC053048]|uniref:peptidoglycan DD-metalloendopeptidase family protein n=1 Tax=Streptomyces sp. NPDC053048 TaxID=3365694 RepID=UPI0037D57659
MASNRTDLDGSSYDPTNVPHRPAGDEEPWAEWNPSEESVAPPARGRHRVVKQRGGTMARSGAVLGVGVIAAVGAGGMASAQDRPAAAISVPDLAQKIPGVGSLLASEAEKDSDATGAGGVDGAGGAGGAGGVQTTAAAGHSTADAGEALRARILQQAEHQQSAADASARESAERSAAESQRKAAAEKAEAHEAEETKKAEQAEKGDGQEAGPEERSASAGDNASGSDSGSGADSGGERSSDRRADRSTGGGARTGSYTLPVGSYTLTAGFGQSGNMWSANHTGEDFAAPTGTPVKAVGGGTVTQAGWAGAYGYRIVLTLNDGTEIWYCHLSSMVVTSGKVGPGTVIGRVGATGNVTGPHLHLEVRPGGGSPVDPLSWLRGRGLQP